MENVPEIKVDTAGLNKHCLNFTQDQRKFATLVLRWIHRPKKKLIILKGGPGTGKSYVVKNIVNCIDVPQLRMSFTARSAQAIDGVTIHSAVNLNWLPGSDYEKIEQKIKDIDDLEKIIELSQDIVPLFDCKLFPLIIIMDEVAMIPFHLICPLIEYFMNRTRDPILFICMGDQDQLKPIKSIYNLFSAIHFFDKLYEVHEIHLTESKRFTPEYGIIINKLRKFVDKGDESGLFWFICEHFPTVDSINTKHLSQVNRAMAFRNERVKYFNNFYVKNMISGPIIDLGNNLIVRPGCSVFVTKNGCSDKAKNGTPLIFKSYDKSENENIVICVDPQTQSEVIISRDNTNHFPLDLGFAGTVHKFQGNTIDDAKIVISFDGNRNLNLAYTALSRVRHMDQILAIEL